MRRNHGGRANHPAAFFLLASPNRKDEFHESPFPLEPHSQARGCACSYARFNLSVVRWV